MFYGYTLNICDRRSILVGTVSRTNGMYFLVGIIKLGHWVDYVMRMTTLQDRAENMPVMSLKCQTSLAIYLSFIAADCLLIRHQTAEGVVSHSSVFALCSVTCLLLSTASISFRGEKDGYAVSNLDTPSFIPAPAGTLG